MLGAGKTTLVNQLIEQCTIERISLEDCLPKLVEWDEADATPMLDVLIAAMERKTRELLQRYSQLEGVQSGIRANFRSGSWTGPTSLCLKRKRDQLRTWLAAGFESEVAQ